MNGQANPNRLTILAIGSGYNIFTCSFLFQKKCILFG